MMSYSVYSEGGQELAAGIQQLDVARRIAQECADETGETVLLDTVPSSTNPEDDEDCGEVIAPRVVVQ